MIEKRPKQACDICRQRKRKCDGLKPSCGPCLKSKSRGSNCTYSSTKNCKGLTEAVLSRMESLERIFGPIGGDGSITDKLISFLDKSDLILNKTLCNSTSHSPLSIPISIHSPVTAMDIPKFSSLFPEPILEKTTSDMSFIGSPAIDYCSFDETIEQHLLGLADLFYCGFSVDNDFRQVIPTDRGRPLSNQLKRAICCNAIFLSKNPALFGTSNPTYEQRCLVSKRYSFSLLSMGENVLSSIGKTVQSSKKSNEPDNQELCDDIRAMFVHTMTLFGMGHIENAFMVASAGLMKAKVVKLFDAVSFYNYAPQSVLTADDLMSVVPKQVSDPRLGPKNIQEIQRQERFALLAQCIVLDTYCVVSLGVEFMLNEAEIPVLEFVGSMEQQPLFHESPRIYTPTLAANTIWEESPLACMVDDMLEMKSIMKSLLSYSTYRSSGLIKAFRLFRQIIRFSRGHKFGLTFEQVTITGLDLHNQVLRNVAEIKNMIPFSTLEVFAPGSPILELPRPSYARVVGDIYQLLVANFTMLAYLHLPISQSIIDVKFPLAYGRSAMYSSKDIMYSLVKALEHLIKFSYTPLKPSDSVFGPYPYPPNKLLKSMNSHLDPSIPSPMFLCPSNAMLSYVICSSAVIAHRTTPINEPMLNILTDSIRTNILPAMHKISTIWPVATLFITKLNDVLQGGGPDFWSFQNNYA